MSKNTDNPEPEIDSSENRDPRNIDTSTASTIECAKCGATRVAYSRLQRFDGLKMHFMAKQPYRCLHCYHRFWVSKPASGNPKRAWTYCIVGVLSLFLVLNVLGLFDSAPEPESERVNVIVPELDSPVTNADESPPSMARLINTPLAPVESAAQTTVSVNDIPVSLQAFSGIPEESLTPEQKAKQLLLAKQQSEAAELRSQERVQRLEKTLLPVPDELESLLKVEIGYVVERWRESWSDGDAGRYLANYSEAFTPPNEVARDRWEAGRRYRVKPEKNIQLELADMNIVMLEELSKGVVEFNQQYQSGDYVEMSRKRLELVREDGTWKIATETEIE